MQGFINSQKSSFRELMQFRIFFKEINEVQNHMKYTYINTMTRLNKV